MNNNTVEPNMKVCTGCKCEFPFGYEFFYKNKKSKDGLTQKCKECVKKIANKYVEENREAIYERNKKYAKINKRNEYQKEWRKKHPKPYKRYGDPEKIKATRKKYIKTHTEQIRKYKENNREKILESKRIYRELNKVKIKTYNAEYRKKNKHVRRLQKIKREQLIGLQIIDFDDNKWKQCKLVFNNKCAYCGKEKKLSQDHFIPISNGGEYSINNIVPACTSCNSSKNNKDFFEWYPKYKHFAKKREQAILKYLGIQKDNTQQMTLL